MRELFPPLFFPPGHLRGEQSFPLKGTDSQPSPASRKIPPFEKGRPLLGVTPPTRGNMPLAQALHLSPEEKRKHKEKCLVHSPRSCFMGVRCPVSHEITTGATHKAALHVGCSTVLTRPQEEKQSLQTQTALKAL